MTKEQLVHAIAERLMLENGYSKYDRDHIEWDATRDDSQFSLTIDTVGQVLQVAASLGATVILSTSE
jgi:hypothetical protein